MSEVRGLALITVSNPDGVVDVARRATDFIDAHLPGTLVWEVFLDRDSGRGLMYQLHASEEAERDYEQAKVEQSFQRDLGQHAELDEIIVLSPITTPEAKAELEQFGGVSMDRVAGVSR